VHQHQLSIVDDVIILQYFFHVVQIMCCLLIGGDGHASARSLLSSLSIFVPTTIYLL
jgi:hypothetical protein